MPRSRLLQVGLAAVLAALVPAGCSRDVSPPEPAAVDVSPETFARALGDLVAARVETFPDTAAYRQRRTEILARHGLTAEDLRRFARAYGNDDDVMAAVYERLGATLDTLSVGRGPDGARPVPSPRPPPADAGADTLPDRPAG